MTKGEKLLALAERVEACEACDLGLDVSCEIALFEPDGEYVQARPNAAGTKVIFSRPDGSEGTHWPDDWTLYREQTAAALRARALGQECA